MFGSLAKWYDNLAKRHGLMLAVILGCAGLIILVVIAALSNASR